MQAHGSFDNDFARSVIIFVGDNSYHLLLTIARITFKYSVKVQFMVLTEALDHQKIS